jgi:hypothetical protein
MSFSLIINFFVFAFLKFTGLGQDCWQRFMWKIKFRNGNYAYSLVLTNSGKLEEVFKPVTDGLFNYEGNKFNRNPKMTVLYRGLPAHFHREGIVEPVDPYGTVDVDIHKLSTQELDNIMSANDSFNFLEWFENNKIIILGVILLIVLAGGLSAYFGYQSFELLRDAQSVGVGVVNPR